MNTYVKHILIGLSFCTFAVTFDARSAAATEPSSGTSLDEIIVTAQKREERIQDVPIPVTVISGDSLVQSNQLKFQDYYTQVPGLSFAPGIESAEELSIRGITTGGPFTASAVGVMIDDVPFGATNSPQAPDIDPGDLARVEVLRGPQGTLYGSSSMGGLLKYVTVDPSMDAVSGRVEAGASSIYNGAELGYNFRASVNVPLTDDLAVRVSGFTRQDPGYIDNTFLHINGVNKAQVEGGRLSALWRPSDTFSINLGALFQQDKANGTSESDVLPGLTDLQQINVRNAGGDGAVGSYEKKAQLYSATITAKLAGIDLKSITSYNRHDVLDSFDATSLVGSGFPGSTQSIFGVSGTPQYNEVTESKLTQEIRLSASIGSQFDWVLGGFFTHEDAPANGNATFLRATDPTTGVLASFNQGLFLHGIYSSTYIERAVFADFTVHVTDRFDVQVGGRETWMRQYQNLAYYGPYGPALAGVTDPYMQPENRYTGTFPTYLLTPRFVVSPDLMVYLRLASGFQPGGGNLPGPGVPPQFAPDTTKTYEIGAKGDVFDHALSFDLSVYYIDWSGIQLGLVSEQTHNTYTGNGGSAKSQGVELSVHLKPIMGLTIAGWVDFADAEITQIDSNALSGSFFAAPGDPLPYSARFSGNLSLSEAFALADNWAGFAGFSASYVGQRWDIFTGTAATGGPSPRQELPAYAKMDLNAGVKHNSWTATFYVNNIADKRGLLTGGIGAIFPNSFYYITPRTVGLSIAKTF